MKRWFAPLVVGMVLLYSVLAVGAAGCLFMPRDKADHAHHGSSHAGHSMFCAWACQVNPTVGIHATAPALVSIIFVTMQRLVSAPPPARLVTTVSRSRAPPH